jgi:hypothetical protein
MSPGKRPDPHSKRIRAKAVRDGDADPDDENFLTYLRGIPNLNLIGKGFPYKNLGLAIPYRLAWLATLHLIDGQIIEEGVAAQELHCQFRVQL